MTMPPQSAPSRGWYADPERPGNERWWTGCEWTEHSVRLQPAGMFGIEYVRSMRPGPNTAAARAMLIGRLALVPFLGSFVLLFIATATGQLVWYALVGVAAIVTIALAIPTIVFAVIGLRRSPALGAKQLSINMLVSASILIVLSLVLFAI